MAQMVPRLFWGTVSKQSQRCCGYRQFVARSITSSVYQNKTQDWAATRSQLHTEEQKAEAKLLRPARAENRSSELNIATAKMRDATKAGRYAEAMQMFASIESPDGVLCNAALTACARGQMFARADEIWAQMPQEHKTTVSYGAMIDVSKRRRHGHRAEALFSEMKAAGLEPTVVTVCSMISTYGMVNDHRKAVELFESIESTLLPKSTEDSQRITFSAVMSACARAGDYAATREIFVKMTEVQVKPDQRHFNALLSSCQSNADAATAQGVFDTMVAWQLEPRCEDYTALIGASRGNLPRCIEIFAQMKGAGIPPTRFTYQGMLEAYVLGRDVQGATALIEEGGDVLSAHIQGSRKTESLVKELEIMKNDGAH